MPSNVDPSQGDERLRLKMGAPSRPDDDVSLAWLLGVLRRRRFLIAACALLPAVALAVILLVKPRMYTASASFVPQSKEANLGNFAGLAAQLGVAVPQDGSGDSPAFYGDLLVSRGILGPVVEATYDSPGASGGSITLADWLTDDEGSRERRRDEALEELRSRLATGVGKTGIVTVAVRTESPTLSHAVLTRILEEIRRYNRETRQSQAAAERRFAEERMGVAEAELRAAERDMQRFLERNRTYASSPELTFEHGRLQRQIQEAGALRASLRDAVERARIDEVRDTPIITFVERPEVPARPDPRGLVIKVALVLVVGLVVGAVLALLLEYLRASRFELSARRELHTFVPGESLVPADSAATVSAQPAAERGLAPVAAGETRSAAGG
ncbi:MAG TPA: Wzz/FepE/Etk N-terminal domain-containing protein [Gemmatimonadales bacterium]